LKLPCTRRMRILAGGRACVRACVGSWGIACVLTGWGGASWVLELLLWMGACACETGRGLCRGLAGGRVRWNVVLDEEGPGVV
jgi:hypothetical protein